MLFLYKSLAQSVDDRYERSMKALTKEKITRVLRRKAKDLGFFDPDDAVDFLKSKLALNEELEVTSAEGEVTTIDEALTELAKNRPHLIMASPQRPGLGTHKPGSRTVGNGDKPTFKRSQLKDNAFFQKNQAAIMEAVKDNRIIDDLGR